MTANEEKNELVVVDVPNVQIYAFTVSGWPTPRTAEEVLNAAGRAPPKASSGSPRSSSPATTKATGDIGKAALRKKRPALMPS